MAGAESYEGSANNFDDLVAPKPQVVAHDGLLQALEATHRAGTGAVSRGEVGAVRFADEMIRRYTGALSLNQSGLVEPPLTTAEIAQIQNQIETLSVLTQGNGEASALQDTPTDTRRRGMKTRGKK